MLLKNQKSYLGDFIMPILAFIVIGFGIGWLAGLSISPVVSILLTSVVTLAGGFVGAFSGLNGNVSDGYKKVNPAPLAFLIFGIILGSTIGILVRTHNILGSSGSIVENNQSIVEDKQSRGVLFSSSASECGLFLQASDNEQKLRSLLENLSDQEVFELSSHIDNLEGLNVLIGSMCK